ncbi:amidase [Xanthomonas phaseoli pv. phaseoli]|uniref:Secreted peptide amidase n=1 Tax=Xanthomonas campestris pv. phaseoli TaxID=317013 RepID=A0AB38DZV7_XANCH|nr:amidase [Xanthomonas phaseoli pv. phaseoli]KHD66844.1 amidase [Xanthomonas phaseoli pv. phaseoli]KHS24799.1 amidase [Xanthomonas phaseoli pv. phaseoli]SON81396.1 putative secreted peptide amidase [Xanthomonas phaseoli pv. phaseoli]SON84303.1 putative secreted peptide amidase [Xanthomonas phaseoli pv. phaseoli]
MRSTPLSFALLAALCGCAHADDPSRSATGAANASTVLSFDLSEADVAGLQARMASGQSSSLQLTRAYLQRIAGIDRAGPRLNSVIELNPQAEADARALDAERKAGHVRGPLHGIPVLLKDNIDALPMVNSAGSLALAEFRPDRDAFVVQRLRAAGAVILSKTNLSEWANFRSTQSSSGWSGRGGLTRNPYALDRNPCGSSAGTGAAIAASLATVGIGTETDGSITCPASVNGLVGLKPTVGLVSRDGIIPISASQDTAGPMTRSVADAAAVLQAIAAPDPQDPATAKAPATSVDYLAHLKPDSLRGARLGLLRNPLREDPAIAAALDRAVRTLRDAGDTVVETALATDGKWDAAEQTVLLVEFKAGLNAYLQNHRAPVASLEQLIAFNRTQAQREMPYFGQELFEQAQAAPGLDDAGYLSARATARRLAGPEGIDAALKADRLDALIVPTTGAAWITTLGKGDTFPGAGYGAAAVAGYPSLSVPMGQTQGLPLGLLFMGTAWSEPRLIELAYAYEQRSHARFTPGYAPSAPSARDPATSAPVPVVPARASIKKD